MIGSSMILIVNTQPSIITCTNLLLMTRAFVLCLKEKGWIVRDKMKDKMKLRGYHSPGVTWGRKRKGIG